MTLVSHDILGMMSATKSIKGKVGKQEENNFNYRSGENIKRYKAKQYSSIEESPTFLYLIKD